MKTELARVFCAVLLFTGCLQPVSPAFAADAVSVKTVQPQLATLRKTTSQPATARAYYEAELYAKVAGYAGKLSVDIGDVVAVGQELLRIEVPEMEKAFERSVAEAVRVKADITRVQAAMQVSKALVQQAVADIQKGEAQVAADQSEFDRAIDLVKSGAVTPKVKDEAENRLRAARASLESMKENLNVTRARERAAAAEFTAAEAAATVAQKSMEEMKVMLEYSSIKAPFAGLVTQRSVDPGDLVRNPANSDGSREPLFTVSKVDVLRVTVPVPEKDAVWVGKNDAVEISFPAVPGEVFKSVVSRAAGRLDPMTRTMSVEIDLKNEKGRLIPGMYGNVVIIMQEKTGLVVPADAVRFNESGSESIVYVVKGGSAIAHVPVKIGMDDGHHIEILSGLTGGERIVTHMLNRLADGQAVKVLDN